MKRLTLAILTWIVASSIVSAQIIKTFAGGGMTLWPNYATSQVGTPTSYNISFPPPRPTYGNAHLSMSSCLDKKGNLFICLPYASQVLKVDAQTNLMSQYAGNGTSGYSGDNSLAVNASLFEPCSAVADTAGNLYIADFRNNCIRMVNAKTGIISRFAGGDINDPNTVFTGNLVGDSALAANVFLSLPIALAIDNHNNLYISRFRSAGVSKVNTSTGYLTQIVGNVTPGFSNANQLDPLGSFGIAVDNNGNVFMATGGSNTVVKMNPLTGTWTIVAGNKAPGYSGDGGLATAAGLNNPTSVSCDAKGNLIISDNFNNRVRKVDATTGIITTIAGTGASGFYGDGKLATKAHINGPQNIALDLHGNIYISDSTDFRLRIVYVDSTKESYTCDGFKSSLQGIREVTGCYGTLTPIVSAGTLPYTYSWSNGSTSATINNLCYGTSYFIRVTDSIGCSTYSYDTIWYGQVLQITTNSQPASGINQCNGSFSMNISGGVPPYQVRYPFSTSQAQHGFSSLSNLCPSYYYAIVTDSIGNRDSINFFIGSQANTFNDSTINRGYYDSTVVATLTTPVIQNCTINYRSVDSVYISSYSIIGQDSVNVVWAVDQKGTPNTVSYVQAKYGISQNGVYTFVVQLYCGTTGVNDTTSNVIQATQSIYINKGLLGVNSISPDNNQQAPTTLYPVPFKDELNLSFATPDSHFVTVYDILGNQVTSRTQVNGASNAVLNLASLGAGIYMVKVETNNHVEFIKTIKN